MVKDACECLEKVCGASKKTKPKTKTRSVKGAKSKTHKGDKDYTTKKGDKDFHQGGKDVKKKRKPYTKSTKQKDKESKKVAKPKTVRPKKYKKSDKQKAKEAGKPKKPTAVSKKRTTAVKKPLAIMNRANDIKLSVKERAKKKLAEKRKGRAKAKIGRRFPTIPKPINQSLPMNSNLPPPPSSYMGKEIVPFIAPPQARKKPPAKSRKTKVVKKGMTKAECNKKVKSAYLRGKNDKGVIKKHNS